MPEVTETPTYSLWRGKGGSEFKRICGIGTGFMNSPFINECWLFMQKNLDVYDVAWKHDDGEVWVIRRDGAKRGGEE